MGYYTTFKVKIISGQLPEYEQKIITDGFTTLEELITTKACDGYGNPFTSECKWYEHDEHMIKFSKLYPDIILELSGVGEENGDEWKSYYKNGKSVTIRPTVVWGQFNESMLK